MLTVEVAQQALLNAGVRLTPQRLMVVDALVGNRSHPTVEQIYDIVRSRYPAVSLATVYQTVSLLARHGLIRELHGSKDGMRCDPDVSVHAHAYCTDCGQVFDVALEHAARCQMESLPNFHVTREETYIYGQCAECAKPSFT